MLGEYGVFGIVLNEHERRSTYYVGTSQYRKCYWPLMLSIYEKHRQQYVHTCILDFVVCIVVSTSKSVIIIEDEKSALL